MLQNSYESFSSALCGLGGLHDLGGNCALFLLLALITLFSSHGRADMESSLDRQRSQLCVQYLFHNGRRIETRAQLLQGQESLGSSSRVQLHQSNSLYDSRVLDEDLRLLDGP